MQNFDWVPQGNTVQGVNKKILEYLFTNNRQLESVFDIPCGDGTFMLALKKAFPKVTVAGIDLMATPLPEAQPFFKQASAKDWSFVESKKFEAITCISGVMAFDDISGTFERAAKHLQTGGTFIVTNDNVMSLRDRLCFLFLGRVKRFSLAYRSNEGNWNLILPQALWSLGARNGFELIHTQYHTPKIEDWAWIPFSLLLYPLQWLSLIKQNSNMPSNIRTQLFPFAVLWKRHYILYFKKV